MQRANKGTNAYVYGLDIGTRSIVGTVGYRQKDRFVVVAQQVKEHESRAMLDGQIHDIGAVSDMIREVTDLLESKVGEPLKQVCIAAAGRVLKTVTVHVDMDLEGEKTVSKEDIHMLNSYGVEKAYEIFQKDNDSEMKFYCVGYSIIHYYMNGYPMNNLESHKAKEISADMIATFLPDDVVDGLYKAVELAGLEVANLTLEPIAAIELAIPDMYRMLNIALIDVGAGTSDISITKDGSIIAYGMLPVAGDCLTEDIARHCLVDFQTAEQIKRGIEKEPIVEYKDIMGLPQKISKDEVLAVVEQDMEDMASQAAEKIKELNGNKPVSAVFVVGGGGKIDTYTDRVAKHLGIAPERCAVRGEEVMQKVDFMERDAARDSLMVTPIGICLNFYEQSNNFIFVTFNDKRVKLYDNNRLAIVDAAILAEFPNEDLFPKRGEALEFTLNGKPMTIRGGRGESATVLLNGDEADIHTAIRSNDVIKVIPSTAGDKAEMVVSKLPEYDGSLTIHVDGNDICVPKLASVNGELQSSYYQIQNGDQVELLNYYTVAQILEFMDIVPENIGHVMVNNEVRDLSAKVYDNFTVSLNIEEQGKSEANEEVEEIVEDFVEEVSQPVADVPKAEAVHAMIEQANDENYDPNASTDSGMSALEKAKADAEKLVVQSQYERAEAALAQMVQMAMSGATMPATAASDLRVTKSSKELYGSLQSNINRLKSGTSIVELRDEAIAEEAAQNAAIAPVPAPAVEPVVATVAEPAPEAVEDKPAEVHIPPMSTETVNGKVLQILNVLVNNELVTLKGKPDYIYVDVFEFIEFDLSRPQGKSVETLINGRKAQYTEPLQNGDKLEIFWKD
ncbi:MAG: rod shape-determining protein [Lachnospiraceae bacterium]|nr:rod shape-determining protein [Lachnospiraceae bacterium]